MKQSLAKITLHGILGETVGKHEWNLAVNSVSEAVHAIEILSRRKLYKFLYNNDKRGVRYKIIVNGKTFKPPKSFDLENPTLLENNELTIKRKIETIDFVPVIQGSGGDGMNIGMIIAGVILVILGAATSWLGGAGVPAIIAGIGLIAGGILGLLADPPKHEDFRDVDKGSAASYLFNGPENTANEGGPVPLLYGRLIVGSQTVAASYNITYRDASISALTS